MKSLNQIFAYLVFLLGPVLFVQSEQRHFFGSHVFIELGNSYSYASSVGFAYLKNDMSIAIFAARVMESFDRMKSQFQNSSAVRKVLPISGRTIYRQETKSSGMNSVQYFLPLGDEIESAVVGATVIFSKDLVSTSEEIERVLDTVTWQPDTDLDFGGAEFFDPIETGNLIPSVIIGNRIVYTVDGRTIVHAPFQLYIGKNLVRTGIDVNSEEFERQIVTLETDGGIVLAKDKNQVHINGLDGVELKLTYSTADGEHRKRFVFFFWGTFVYFIGAVSNDPTYDKYFDGFDDIVQQFSVKK